MMDVLKPYTIPFKGLKEGIHHFEFRLDGAFFQEFENEELADSLFEVKLTLDKHPGFLELDFVIEGALETLCDRCNEALSLSQAMQRRMIARVDGDAEDDDIIRLAEHDDAVDLSRALYETVVMGLPLKRAHEETACNPAVLERLNTYSRGDSEESDPRWDALKKLK